MPLPNTGPQTPRKHGPPPVVAVASGKDGVGKSSIVVNLGLTLAKAGRRACVWDFDSGPGNVLFLLGLHPKYKAEQLLLQQRTLPEILLEAHHGLRLLPAAGTLGQHGPFMPVQERHLADQITTLEEQFDCVLLDTAAGGGASPAFIAAADLILLVLTPDAACLADTSELVQRLENERNAEYHVLVNRVSSQNEAWEVFNRFSSLVQEHSDARLRLLGFVPRDESLSAAAMLQRPVALFPDSDPSARTFLRLAEALDRAFSRLPHTARPTDAWMRRLRMLTTRPSPPRAPFAASPEKAVAPEPGVLPEGLAETLNRLRDRITRTLHDDAEATTVASWIDAIASTYWDQRGQPAIDLPQAVARLVSETGHDAMLSRLRTLIETLHRPALSTESGTPTKSAPLAELASEIPTPVVGTPAEPTQGYPTASAAGVPTRSRDLLTPEEKAEIQRVWAMDASELDRQWESAVPLTLTPRRGVARTLRAHSIDVKRFGPQQQLIDMLRKRAPTDEPLADWLRRVGSANA
jgi:flagellar biosynthesis protein FlhG